MEGKGICELCEKALTGDELVCCTGCSDRLDVELQPFVEAVNEFAGAALDPDVQRRLDAADRRVNAAKSRSKG